MNVFPQPGGPSDEKKNYSLPRILKVSAQKGRTYISKTKTTMVTHHRRRGFFPQERETVDCGKDQSSGYVRNIRMRQNYHQHALITVALTRDILGDCIIEKECIPTLNNGQSIHESLF